MKYLFIQKQNNIHFFEENYFTMNELMVPVK